VTTKYVFEERNGKTVRVYETGMIKTEDGTRWVTPPPGAATFHTSERGKELYLRRQEKSQQRAIEAIDAGAGLDRSKWGTGQGWFTIIEHTVKTYLQSKNIRGMGEVLAKLAGAAGYTSKDSGEGSAIAEAIASLLEKLIEERRREIIEGKVTDV